MVDKLGPTYPQFTNLALGEGLFDQLMATVKFHCQEEFQKQRITGADYAKVFLGSMESVLVNTSQYLLGVMLYEQQKAKIEAEIKVLELEGDKLEYEIQYMFPAMLVKLQQEGLLIEAQVRLAEANILKTEAEIDKINAEILMLESQKLLIDAQILKINAEILYIDAKIKTEKANTEENFTDGSVIGRQTTLLKAQQLGFAGDLDYKVSKLHADYQSLWQSVMEDDTVATTVLQGDLARGVAPTGVASSIKSLP